MVIIHFLCSVNNFINRFTGSAAESADRLLLRWWQRGQKPINVKDKREAKTSRFALINQMIFF